MPETHSSQKHKRIRDSASQTSKKISGIDYADPAVIDVTCYANSRNATKTHATNSTLTHSTNATLRNSNQEQPVVEPQVSHFRQVPLRTSVKFAHSGQASPT